MVDPKDTKFQLGAVPNFEGMRIDHQRRFGWQSKCLN